MYLKAQRGGVECERLNSFSDNRQYNNDDSWHIGQAFYDFNWSDMYVCGFKIGPLSTFSVHRACERRI